MPAVLLILCLLAALPAAADSGPTLARLYYKIPADRLEEFAGAYQELVEPFVDKHGLVESSVPAAPPAGEGFFVRVFEFSSPAAWAAARKAIDDDPQLPELRRDLVAKFPFLAEPGSSSFTLLTAPAEPETTRVAGPGKTAAVGAGRGIWRTYDVTNGLAGPWVRSIIQDRQGHLWFATYNDGVSRYDGQTWKTFTTEDGLVDDRVGDLFVDRDGNIWFATAAGVSRFDGKTWASFTTEDGLTDDRVVDIEQDRDGDLWFGSWANGVSRYDGRTFTTFTTADGLVDNRVAMIYQDRNGDLWFAGNEGKGVSRYDGQSFTSFTTEDGLPHDDVLAMCEDDQGHIWFATHGGISRYDGETFTTWTTRDGLGANDVHAIFQGPDGDLWIGTDGGGISRYDGQVFQNLTVEDGLASNLALCIVQDQEGSLWICSGSGLTRFRPPPPTPFPVFVDAVVADRRYQGMDEVTLPANVGLVAFEFRAMSFKTRPDQVVYLYRLRGHDEEWRQTRRSRVEYADLPRGDYVLEVKAVDRDLNYSEPAIVPVTIHFSYAQTAWRSGLGLSILLIILLGVRLARSAHALRQSNERLSATNQDLQLAKEAAEGANRAKSQFLANIS